MMNRTHTINQSFSTRLCLFLALPCAGACLPVFAQSAPGTPPSSPGSHTPAVAPSAGSQAPRDFPAFTEPSVRADMNFAIPSSEPSVILEVLVKEGDAVKKGQPLVRLDDRQVRAQYEAQKLEAESDLRVDAAIADLDVRQLELVRLEKIFSTRAASDNEVEEARAAVRLRAIQVDIERLTQQIRKAQAEQLKVRLEQMTLFSPIDGTVERMDLVPGEVPDPSRPSAVVVANHPLWVNAFIPAEHAINIRVGDEFQVKMRRTGQTAIGKVIFAGSVIDPGSGTRRIKLEVPNTENVPAGQDVLISIPPAAAAAANR